MMMMTVIKGIEENYKQRQKKGSAADVGFFVCVFHFTLVATASGERGQSGRLEGKSLIAHIMLMHFIDAATAAVNIFLFFFCLNCSK